MRERRRRIGRFLTDAQIKVPVAADQPGRDIRKFALDLADKVSGSVDAERPRNEAAVEHFRRGGGDEIGFVGAKPYARHEPLRRAARWSESPQPGLDRHQRFRCAVQVNEPFFPHGLSVTAFEAAAIRSQLIYCNLSQLLRMAGR